MESAADIDVREIIQREAALIARAHEGKSVVLTCYASVYHDGIGSNSSWVVDVGHNKFFGKSLPELYAQIDNIPAARRARIAELRSEADKLENELLSK